LNGLESDNKDIMDAYKQKMANQVSHRYNCLPLLPSGPGGVRQELVVLICRCKGKSNWWIL